ncbi:MAG: hypothetical protein ACK4K3_07375 [Aquabacterium sp.]
MTAREALALKRPRPWWRKVGRFLIDLGHVSILVAIMTVPGALIDLYGW